MLNRTDALPRALAILLAAFATTVSLSDAPSLAATANAPQDAGSAGESVAQHDGVQATAAGPTHTYWSWGVDALNVPQAWSRGITGAGVIVAIVEVQGFDTTHPYYAGAIDWCVDLSGVSGRCHSNVYAQASHGTKVAGIVHQVAPDARLYLISMTGSSSVPARQYQEAIDLALRGPPGGRGADVISISAGVETLQGSSPPGWGAVLSDVYGLNVPATVPVVAAAGNYGAGPGTVSFPGAHPSVISVTALGQAPSDPLRLAVGGPAVYVHSGASDGVDDGEPGVRSVGELDVAAPGMAVTTTVPGGGTGTGDQTSMATPHVSALVALLREAQPELSREEIRERLWCASHDLVLTGKFTTPGYDISTGYGMPDAIALLDGTCYAPWSLPTTQLPTP